MKVSNIQKASIEELVQEYEQAAVTYGQALAAANHRAANRAHDRIAGAYRELRRRAAASHLLPLLKNEDENVRAYPQCYARGSRWSTPGPNLPYSD